MLKLLVFFLVEHALRDNMRQHEGEREREAQRQHERERERERERSQPPERRRSAANKGAMAARPSKCTTAEMRDVGFNRW